MYYSYCISDELAIDLEEVEVFNITLSILSSTSGMRIQLGDIRNAVGIIHDSSKTIIRVMCFL